MKRKVILLLSVGLLITALAWLFVERSPEPILAAIAATIGILTQVADRPHRARGGGEPTTGHEPDPRRGEGSLLVLPFENLGGDPEDDYFSDGLTEELIAGLAHVPRLRVISRRSAMKLKGSEKDLEELARDLGVEFVVEGGVRKSGNAVRITVHLVNAYQDAELWSDRYDGTLEDMFAFQEEVSEGVVQALHLKFAPERARMGKAPADPRAFEAYLRGKHEMSDWTREGCEKAIRYFSTGLEILGENALLHAGVGNANFRLAHIVPGGMTEHMRAAGDSARRSLELDPGLVTGHVLSGLVDWKKGAIGSALRHFRDALEIDPDNDEALTWATWCYATVGDVDFLDGHVQRLLLVDPLDALTRAVVGLYALYATKVEHATEALEQSLSLDSAMTFAKSLAAFAQLQLGNVEEARSLLQRLVAGGRDDIWTHLGTALQAAVDGRPLALPEHVIADSRKDETFAWFIAECHALLGNKAEAIEWLDHALEWGFSNVAFVSSHCTSLSLVWGEPTFENWVQRATTQQRQALAVARQGLSNPSIGSAF